ncbi:MAG: RNA polymerase sigma factor [Hymenobacter sp.]|nr:MAG: RNA polymerase sigma factor [Hymenobacter sp.]
MGFLYTPSAEDHLLQQASQGERRALERLVQTHQAMAYTVALRVVGNQQDAEEVVQDAFLKAFGALAQFQRAAKFSTWLYRIVYNTALTKQRARSAVGSDVAESLTSPEGVRHEPGSWEQLEQADRQKYITLALNSLPAEEALVLTLHYLGEKSIAEICVILNKKTSAVKMQLLRGRHQVAHVLHQLLPTEFRNL